MIHTTLRTNKEEGLMDLIINIIFVLAVFTALVYLILPASIWLVEMVIVGFTKLVKRFNDDLDGR